MIREILSQKKKGVGDGWEMPQCPGVLCSSLHTYILAVLKMLTLLILHLKFSLSEIQISICILLLNLETLVFKLFTFIMLEPWWMVCEYLYEEMAGVEVFSCSYKHRAVSAYLLFVIFSQCLERRAFVSFIQLFMNKGKSVHSLSLSLFSILSSFPWQLKNLSHQDCFIFFLCVFKVLVI